ncbi:MAG: Threonine dehydrogenase and related Zn-dependent dehydrogenases, partial [uncultured Solirubrobacteraceae bacterium]
EGTGLARQARRPRRQRPGSDDPGVDRRDHPHHVDRPVRLRPAPVRGDGALHRRGRHPRPRADGDRRGGRHRRHRHQAGRPRGHPVQHLLRPLLDVQGGPAVAVRDDAEPRHGHRRLPVRLHEALRPGRRRAGGVPARPAGAVRADQGPRRPAGRSLRLPLRRPADRVAGGRVRQHPEGRQRHHPRPRADRRDVRPHRPAPGRRAGHRRRPRARAPRPRPRARRAGPRPLRARLHRRRDPRAHRRPRHRLGDRRGRDGGARRADRQGRPPDRRPAARRRRAQDDGDGGRRSARGAARVDRHLPPRRDDLPLGRLRGCRVADAAAHHVRQAAQPPHGPGERQALDPGDHAAARGPGRPARRRHLRHPPGAARGGAPDVRDVPEEAGRRVQDPVPAV